MNLRFLQFKIDQSTQEIYSKMKENQFSEGTETGFLIDNILNDRVEGRYIYRKTIESVDADPFGNEIANSFTSFDIYEFSLDKRSNTLFLRNSPRDIKLFIARLNTLFDYRITIENPRIHLLSLAEYLENQLQDCFLASIEIDDIFFSALTTGKVLIKGKEGIRKYLADATYQRKQYHVARIGIQAVIAHRTLRLEISERGVVRFPSFADNQAIINEMTKLLKKYMKIQ